MKAIKKPIEIEYYPCEFKYIEDILKWKTDERPIKVIRFDTETDELNLLITTLEWTHSATNNDMIIKWINWEVYPCKKEIFKKTYDLIP